MNFFPTMYPDCCLKETNYTCPKCGDGFCSEDHFKKLKFVHDYQCGKKVMFYEVEPGEKAVKVSPVEVIGSPMYRMVRTLWALGIGMKTVDGRQQFNCSQKVIQVDASSWLITMWNPDATTENPFFNFGVKGNALIVLIKSENGIKYFGSVPPPKEITRLLDVPVIHGCVACHKVEGVRKCGQCKYASYCSIDCQKKDWPTHKLECVKAKEFKSSSVKKESV